ncbi:MAG TPA: PrsW family glutamic-type intramembrane protease [Verrucomicrobiae bacterium]|nr:PrsW family glutamic-type intramembrane protease [Verrucomicrobiae bacterium]
MSAQTKSNAGVIFTCIAGPDSGKRLAITEDEVSLGRSAKCHMLSDDPDVAQRHATFRLDDGKVRYQATGSAEVFVDGHPSRQGVLEPKQQIRLGRSTWQLAGRSSERAFNDFIDNLGQKISSVAGVERIQGFDLRATFSEVFRKHADDEVEAFFNVGGPTTTPPLAQVNTSWPKPWLFFRTFALSVAVYFAFLFGWNEFNNTNLLPGLMMVGSLAIPFSILMLFFEVNVLRNISLYQVLKAVLVGGILSLILTLFLYQFFGKLENSLGAVAVGIFEEVGKAAALLLVINKLRYRWTLNGLLLGAAIGTGFAAFESSGYAFNYLWNSASTEVMTQVIKTRAWLSILGGHVLWAAIVGAALWKVRGDRKFEWKMLGDLRFLRVLGLAAALHAVWDCNFEPPLYLKEIVLGFVVWVVILSFIQEGLKQVREEQLKHSPTPTA